MEKSNLPWSIKGISPEARQAAKELAAEAGKPMGAWLSEAIHHISQLEREAEQGGPAEMAAAPPSEPRPPGHPQPAHSQPGRPPSTPVHDAIEAESVRPYDTAGYAGPHAADDMAILAQRIAKAERWTARSVAPLRQAIE